MSGADAATLVVRALERMADAAGTPATIVTVRSRAWHSATFAGARHAITLEGADDAAMASWLGGLGEAEFALRGHLVADCIVQACARTAGRAVAEVEILTLIEG